MIPLRKAELQRTKEDGRRTDNCYSHMAGGDSNRKPIFSFHRAESGSHWGSAVGAVLAPGNEERSVIMASLPKVKCGAESPESQQLRGSKGRGWWFPSSAPGYPAKAHLKNKQTKNNREKSTATTLSRKCAHKHLAYWNENCHTKFCTWMFHSFSVAHKLKQPSPLTSELINNNDSFLSQNIPPQWKTVDYWYIHNMVASPQNYAKLNS